MMLNLTKAKFLREITRADQAPVPARPSIVFAGRSNVGKSSLINALVQRKGLARTSSTPGRTQNIIYFDIDERFYFIDLPGYGYAKVPKAVKARWKPMVEKFLSRAEGLRLVIVIIDLRRDPKEGDFQLIDWLSSLGLPYIFALTKADKTAKSKRRARIDAIRETLGLQDDSALLPFSAQTGEGRKELIHVIAAALEAKPSASGSSEP